MQETFSRLQYISTFKENISLLKMTLLKHFISFPNKKLTESQVTLMKLLNVSELHC